MTSSPGLLCFARIPPKANPDPLDGLLSQTFKRLLPHTARPWSNHPESGAIVAFVNATPCLEFITRLTEELHPIRVSFVLRPLASEKHGTAEPKPSPQPMDQRDWTADLDEWLAIEGFPDQESQGQLNRLGWSIGRIRAGWTARQSSFVRAMRELRVKRRVAERFGVTPPAVNHVLDAAQYERLRQLESMLQEGLDRLTGQLISVQHDPFHSGSSLPSLHQLPPPPSDFTGRTLEVADLEGAVLQRGAAIVGVRGLAGVGKTAFSLLLAHRLKDHYPDAQIFLNLRGSKERARPATDALSHAVRAFHPDAKLPENEADLEALFRSVLDGKRTLLLLDDALEASQVRPLIPPSGSLLLFTSRIKFSLPGMHSLDLGVLSPREARQFLLRVAPRSESHAEEIADACGHLPLALRMAGSALRETPDLSPADFTARLADRQKRMKLLRPVDESEPSLEGSFRLSYALLSPELQRLWRRLAVFPASFDRAAAAAVSAMDEESARDLLSTLVRHGLLEFRVETQRYILHGLLRAYAESLSGKEEQDAASLGHAEHFLRLAALADNLYLEGHERTLSGLALFDSEWPNIHAGQAWAATHAAISDPAARLCIEFPNAAAHCLALRLPSDEHARWLMHALSAARRLGQRRAEGAHLGNLGHTWSALGDFHRAIECIQQALSISQELDDRHSQAISLGNLGHAHAAIGDLVKAVAYLEQALAISREVGDRRTEAISLGNLGNAQLDLGNSTRAIECSRQALTISRELGDRYGEGILLANLGNAYASLGDAHAAVTHHRQALAIAREMGDRVGEARRLGNLALVFARFGDRPQAIASYEEALAIVEGIDAHETRVLGRIKQMVADPGVKVGPLPDPAPGLLKNAGETPHRAL